MDERPAADVLNWFFVDVGIEVECAVCPLGALGWGMHSTPATPQRSEESRLALWEYARAHLELAHGVLTGEPCPPFDSSSNEAGRPGPPFTHPDDESARSAARKVGTHGRPTGDSSRSGQPTPV